MRYRNPIVASALSVCLGALLSVGPIAQFAGFEGQSLPRESSVVVASLTPSSVALAGRSAIRPSWSGLGSNASSVAALAGQSSLKVRLSSTTGAIHANLPQRWQPAEARVLSDRSPPRRTSQT